MILDQKSGTLLRFPNFHVILYHVSFQSLFNENSPPADARLHQPELARARRRDGCGGRPIRNPQQPPLLLRGLRLQPGVLAQPGGARLPSGRGKTLSWIRSEAWTVLAEACLSRWDLLNNHLSDAKKLFNQCWFAHKNHLYSAKKGNFSTNVCTQVFSTRLPRPTLHQAADLQVILSTWTKMFCNPTHP